MTNLPTASREEEAGPEMLSLKVSAGDIDNSPNIKFISIRLCTT
jgi:hypothetical protein